jgi:hypothetical protein
VRGTRQDYGDGATRPGSQTDNNQVRFSHCENRLQQGLVSLGGRP